MKLDLHWQILIGLLIGAAFGVVFHAFGTPGDDPSLGFLHLSHITWIGELFLKLLKMIVIPLIVSSIIVGVGHLPVQSLGKLGISTLLIFKGQMFFAALVGLVFVNWFKPGNSIDLRSIIGNGAGSEEVQFITDSKLDVGELVFNIIPANIFESLSHGSLLQVILFSILFAVSLIKVKNGKHVLTFFEASLNAILEMTHWIMLLAPVGVMALITKTVAAAGIAELLKYSQFMLTVFAALFTMLIVVGSLVVHFCTDSSPMEFFSKMKEVMLTSFSTSSSAATIPVTLETMEKSFGVPYRLASFVIPLGATMNMNGAAIYESIVTLFVAQAWLPDPLSLSEQIFVVSMVLLATFGTPGIPHGSLITIAIVFQAVGLPLEAIGVILSIDRILDMTRTMINVSFDSISCLVLNKYFKNMGDNFPDEDAPKKIESHVEEYV